jgi:hypothetical protein
VGLRESNRIERGSPTMLRTATLSDIPRLIEICGSVRENRLSDPSKVTLADYAWHICKTAGLPKGTPREARSFL